LSAKPRIEQLKGNVQAQETKLDQEMKMLNAAKKKTGQASEWDALEKVIRLMDDLLTSYRKYTVELEKKAKKLETKAESSARKR
jgi:hypothetical protein